jgi:hypothetical protein
MECAYARCASLTAPEHGEVHIRRFQSDGLVDGRQGLFRLARRLLDPGELVQGLRIARVHLEHLLDQPLGRLDLSRFEEPGSFLQFGLPAKKCPGCEQERKRPDQSK